MREQPEAPQVQSHRDKVRWAVMGGGVPGLLHQNQQLDPSSLPHCIGQQRAPESPE